MTKATRRKRRIRAAKVTHISLCPQGANNLGVLYKADDKVEFSPIFKAMDEEAGELAGVVYAPGVRDKEGDWADREVIKAAAHGFARDGKGVDIVHDGKTLAKTDAYVAESFIVQKDDPRFAGMKDGDGKEVDTEGAWGVVLKIDNEELRRLYREGKWRGISMGGIALYEDEDATNANEPQEDVATFAKFLKLMKSLFGASQSRDADSTSPQGEEEMKPEDIQALAEALAKAMAPQEPPAAPNRETIPFEGDITNKEDLARHLAKLELAKLDLQDPKAVAALLSKADKGSKKSDRPKSTQFDTVDELAKSDDGDNLLELGSALGKAYSNGEV